MSTTRPKEQELDDRILRNMDENHRDLVARFETLSTTVTNHITGEGHTATTNRLLTVEQELDRSKARPVQTWQIIAGIIGLLCTFGFLGLSTLSDALSLIMFIRSLH